MSVQTDDPAVQRRRLRVELRALRKEADLTQRDVAHALDWSPSKLIRIENGDVRITPTDLRALLGHYGVRDSERIDEMVGIARASRKDSWADFKNVHTQPWLTFLAYESSASLIRDYESTYVPGILQTEEYALAAYTALGLDKETAERRWEGRLRRQELHERADPPQMFFVLDEAVIRRQIGGSRVMRRQMDQLKQLSTLPHVSMRVIPFEVGAYLSIGEPFILLEFRDARDDDILHIETPGPGGGVTMRDDVEATSDAVERFLGLEDIALSDSATRQLLDQLIDSDAAPGGAVAAPKPKEAK
jgi:transcriptional regulator with XRE-family HTH domain